MLQTQALKYFLEVVQTGSLRQASLTHLVAPSAISRQIRLLEEDIDAQLFIRTAHGMDLTPAGKLLLKFAQAQEISLHQLSADLADLSCLERGIVRLAVVEATTNELLPGLINSFAEKHPKIQFSVSTVGAIAVADLVARKEVDMGIAFNTPSRDDLKLLARLHQPLRVVFRPQHRLQIHESVQIYDLRNELLALPEPSFSIRQLVENAARNAGVSLNLHREANSLHLLKSLVRTTDLITFLPASSFAVEAENGLLKSIALDDPVCSQATLDFICAKSPSLSIAATAFLSHTLEKVRPIC